MFNAVDGSFNRASYVRLSVYVGNPVLDLLTETLLGTGFIPLEYFNDIDETYTVPLNRFGMKFSDLPTKDQFSRKGVNDLGSITVKIKKIIEATDVPMALRLQSILHHKNVYNSAFFAECVMTGAIETEVREDC